MVMSLIYKTQLNILQQNVLFRIWLFEYKDTF